MPQTEQEIAINQRIQQLEQRKAELRNEVNRLANLSPSNPQERADIQTRLNRARNTLNEQVPRIDTQIGGYQSALSKANQGYTTESLLQYGAQSGLSVLDRAEARQQAEQNKTLKVSLRTVPAQMLPGVRTRDYITSNYGSPSQLIKVQNNPDILTTDNPPYQPIYPKDRDISPLGIIKEAGTGIKNFASNIYDNLYQSYQNEKVRSPSNPVVVVGGIVGSGISRGRQFLSSGEKKVNDFFDSNPNLPQDYKRDILKFNILSSNLDYDIKAFNEKYGNKTLSSREYIQAEQEQTQLSRRIQARDQQAAYLENKGSALQQQAEQSPFTIVGSAAKEFVKTPLYLGAFVLNPIKSTGETISGITSLPSNIVQRPASTLGNLAGSLLGFYVTGKIAGKVIGGSAVDEIAVSNALKSAEVEVKNIKGLTTESQVQNLKITPELKTELLSQIRRGSAVRLSEFELTSLNPEARALIEKTFPSDKTKIYSVEVVDSSGRIILKRNLLGIETQKGRIEYKDFQTGLSVGVYSEKTKTASFQGIQAEFNNRVPEAFIRRTAEVVKVEKPRFFNAITGEVYRTNVGQSFKTLGEPVKFNNPTFEDLSAIAKSEFKPIEYVSANLKELQRLSSGSINIKSTGKETIGIETSAAFGTIKAKGAGYKLPKFLEYEDRPNVSMKPFESTEFKIETPKRIDKVVKNIEKSSNNLLPKLSEYYGKGLYERTESIASRLPASDFSKDVLRLIEKQAVSIPTKSSNVIIPTSKVGVKERYKTFPETSFNLNNLRRNINSPDLDFINLTNINQNLKDNQVYLQGQGSKLNNKQLMKQLQELTQTSTPEFPSIPNINAPKIPPLFTLPSNQWSGNLAGLKKLQKKVFKKQPAYAASLAAAAVQVKPLKITKKQYEELQKAVYSGVEARPVIALDFGENISKRRVRF